MKNFICTNIYLHVIYEHRGKLDQVWIPNSHLGVRIKKLKERVSVNIYTSLHSLVGAVNIIVFVSKDVLEIGIGLSNIHSHYSLW